VYDQEAKEFIQTDHVSVKPKSTKRFVLLDLTSEDHFNRIGVIFRDHTEITYAELIEELKKLYGVGTNIAKQQILPYLAGNDFLTSSKGIYKPNFYKPKNKKR
jgi:hypothetical protein